MRKPILVAALVALTAIIAPPAAAVTWNSAAAPLQVLYNGVNFGDGYGNYYKYGSAATNVSYQRDVVANGNSIFIVTNYYGNSSPLGEKQTDRTSSAAWVPKSTSMNLFPASGTSTGNIRVCEDAASRPDICSSTISRSFTY